MKQGGGDLSTPVLSGHFTSQFLLLISNKYRIHLSTRQQIYLIIKHEYQQSLFLL